MKVNWRILVLAFVVGVCISLVSGFVVEQPRTGIVENKYYGFPFVWRSTDPFVGESYYYLEFFADCVIWAIVAFVIVWLTTLMRKG